MTQVSTLARSPHSPQSPASTRRPAAALTPRGQQTRQQLLDAAEAVFGEHGYDRAAISEITRRAGVAQGTFYVYFDDKKEIFLELVRALGDRLRDQVLAAIEGIDDRMAMERARFASFLGFVRVHRNLYRIVRQCEFVDEELYRWYYRRLAEGYAEGLRRDQQRGQVRAIDPEALAWALMGIADFVGMRWGLWEGRSPPETVFQDLMTFIETGLAPPAPARGPERRATKAKRG